MSDVSSWSVAKTLSMSVSEPEWYEGCEGCLPSWAELDTSVTQAGGTKHHSVIEGDQCQIYKETGSFIYN